MVTHHVLLSRDGLCRGNGERKIKVCACVYEHRGGVAAKSSWVSSALGSVVRYEGGTRLQPSPSRLHFVAQIRLIQFPVDVCRTQQAYNAQFFSRSIGTGESSTQSVYRSYLLQFTIRYTNLDVPIHSPQCSDLPPPPQSQMHKNPILVPPFQSLHTFCLHSPSLAHRSWLKPGLDRLAARRARAAARPCCRLVSATAAFTNSFSAVVGRTFFLIFVLTFRFL